MTKTTTHIAPEEIMAWIDGELAVSDAQSIAEHVFECSECSSIMEDLKSTSGVLSEWRIPEPASAMDPLILQALDHHRNSSSSRTLHKVHSWKNWAFPSAAIAAALLIAVVGIDNRKAASPPLNNARIGEFTEAKNGSLSPAAPPDQGRQHMLASTSNALDATVASKTEETPPPGGLAATLVPQMIVRNSTLVLLVKDVAIARASVDPILAKYGGYNSLLDLDTPQDGERRFNATLRIPVHELQHAISDFKALGRTLSESQAGEEVTQKHTDLVARLQNSRETEQRLRAILQERTGKMQDVLQVEQQISRVRGEIESMEAEQRDLEHQVAFAGLNLQLTEEHKEQFSPSSPISTSTRMHNAAVEGMRNAADTLLSLLLVLEQYGPVIVVWLAIAGVPGYLVWRRYRKVRDSF